MSKKGFDISDLTGDAHCRTFTALKEEEGMRLDRFLRKRLPWMSRARLQHIDAKRIVSGRGANTSSGPLKKSTRILAGDRIEVTLPQEPKDLEEAIKDPPLERLDVIHEDDDILVIDKPAGVAVHPVGMNLHRTVLTALHQLYRRPGDPDGDVVPRLVHRLDLETSGVLLVAKRDEALRDLTEQFRNRTVRKEYLAVTYGLIDEDEGEVDLPLGPEEGSKVPYKRCVDREDGLPARTRFKVLRRQRGLTWVHLEPQTGRKHQLRVHLAAIGHPIVGDKIYGPDDAHYFRARNGPPSRKDLKELLLPRQALHALRLTLKHPGRNRTMCFEAPQPREFETLL
ncbi:MAG: RluA family pseudouridine synthase [Planctomycetota bacterium]